jgi:hypothetical protein
METGIIEKEEDRIPQLNRLARWNPSSRVRCAEFHWASIQRGRQKTLDRMAKTGKLE